jgi:hypothetical protein
VCHASQKAELEITKEPAAKLQRLSIVQTRVTQSEAIEDEETEGDDATIPEVAEVDSSGVVTAAIPGTVTVEKKVRWTGWMTDKTGDIMRTYTSEQLVITWDQEAEVLCSYSWQEHKIGTNVIFVPGAPPKWSPLPLARSIPMDIGYTLVDHNHARQPNYPYHPMFKALEVMNPGVSLSNFDVIADRNNLRTLLEFVQGKHVGPFRMDLHMVDNTLILERKDRKSWMRSKGTDGIGHSFEKHFIKADAGLETASSYYRVISYPLGSLNLAVRVEVDSYYDDTTASGPYASTEESLDLLVDAHSN